MSGNTPIKSSSSTTTHIKPAKAAVLVDKNSRTIVKIMQLQEYLAKDEKEYTEKDALLLRKIGELLVIWLVCYLNRATHTCFIIS